VTFQSRTRPLRPEAFSFNDTHLWLRFPTGQPQMWLRGYALYWGDGRLRLHRTRDQTAATRTSSGGAAGRGRGGSV
jgi:hypothetical protein